MSGRNTASVSLLRIWNDSINVPPWSLRALMSSTEIQFHVQQTQTSFSTLLIIITLVILAHCSWLDYAFIKHERRHLLRTLYYLMDITKALHFTLHREDTHTKQDTSPEFFYIFFMRENKTKSFFLNLVISSPKKSMEHINSQWQAMFTITFYEFWVYSKYSSIILNRLAE